MEWVGSVCTGPKWWKSWFNWMSHGILSNKASRDRTIARIVHIWCMEHVVNEFCGTWLRLKVLVFWGFGKFMSWGLQGIWIKGCSRANQGQAIWLVKKAYGCIQHGIWELFGVLVKVCGWFLTGLAHEVLKMHKAWELVRLRSECEVQSISVGFGHLVSSRGLFWSDLQGHMDCLAAGLSFGHWDARFLGFLVKW